MGRADAEMGTGRAEYDRSRLVAAHLIGLRQAHPVVDGGFMAVETRDIDDAEHAVRIDDRIESHRAGKNQQGGQQGDHTVFLHLNWGDGDHGVSELKINEF